MLGNACPCGSSLDLAQCCARFHQGERPANPGQLMRSRYSAYCLGLVDYLVNTTLPAQQSLLDRQGIADWSQNSQWLGLSVEQESLPSGSPSRGQVTFNVRWADTDGEHSHREQSDFILSNGRWYFLDPTARIKTGRNDPCPCASGQKFKKCCAALIG